MPNEISSHCIFFWSFRTDQRKTIGPNTKSHRRSVRFRSGESFSSFKIGWIEVIALIFAFGEAHKIQKLTVSIGKAPTNTQTFSSYPNIMKFQQALALLSLSFLCQDFADGHGAMIKPRARNVSFRFWQMCICAAELCLSLILEPKEWADIARFNHLVLLSSDSWS